MSSVVFDTLSLPQQVGQMLMSSFQGPVVNDQVRTLLKLAHVGHIILYANNVKSPGQVKDLCTGLRQEALENFPIPLNIAVDQEGGRVTRLKGEGFTQFPTSRSVAQTRDPSLARQVAVAMAKEMKAVGITMNLAPVCDVNTNPLNPVIGNRSFGEDPDTVIRFAGEEIDGFHQEGIQTCLKHYPGHGDTSVDSHFGLPTVCKDRSALEATELAPFKALSSKTDAIMSAHVVLPALDETWCATFSSKILDTLRKSGFQGLIISDSITMEGALKQTDGNIVEAALKAIEAGCDVLCIAGITANPQTILDVHQGIIQAVETGRIAVERIQESLQRVALAKTRLVDRLSQDTPLQGFEEHLQLVRTIAEKSFECVKQDASCHLQGKKLFVFYSSAVKAELDKTTFFGKSIVDTLTDGAEDLAKIESKSPQAADISLWVVHNVFVNSKLQEALGSLAQRSGQIVLMTVGSSYDSTYFKKFANVATIVNTYSPTRDAMQVALERLD